MATEDRFEKAGVPSNTADVYSGTPIGGATVPPETQRLVNTPLGSGTPAPIPPGA